jgi:hypothetical protein
VKWRGVEKCAENMPGSAIMSTARKDDRIPYAYRFVPVINELLNLVRAPGHRIIVPHYLTAVPAVNCPLSSAGTDQTNPRDVRRWKQSRSSDAEKME